MEKNQQQQKICYVNTGPGQKPGVSKFFKKDFLFKFILFFSGFLVFLLVLSIFVSLILNSVPSLKEFGLKFFVSKTWDPVFEQFGALPFITGTLLTSFLAILITIPFSLAISIYLAEFTKQGFYPGFLKNSIDLLAGVPSVVYGFFGIFVIVPIIRYLQIKLHIEPYGVGIFTASIILSIMIIPFSSSLGREIIEMVPAEIKEAAYSLGSTRFEVIKYVILPYARSGITAGILLALGRAIGETMAVTMVIGNSNMMPKSIFSPSNTMASVIANEFTEAVTSIHLSSLIEIGVVLFLVTTMISITGKIIIKKFAVHQ
ncbi:MAG: phosphate ABC transporter permease subunit PstC [Candidatus Omnitrophica bacterium]|jgi:phosphate transport system permease protein|nr:phosphate ABC transporter permease subunit PstC [Candidatus Omnitrophota bacterium]